MLAGSLVFDALNVPAEASAAGARHACWLEVLLYGGLALIALLLMARRAMLRFSPLAACVFGLVAGLVPAALMQLACMYHPYHGLVCHFGPVLILVVLSLLLTKCLAD